MMNVKNLQKFSGVVPLVSKAFKSGKVRRCFLTVVFLSPPKTGNYSSLKQPSQYLSNQECFSSSSVSTMQVFSNGAL